MRVPVASGATGLPVQAGTQGAMPGWNLLLSLFLSSSAVPPPSTTQRHGDCGTQRPAGIG